MASTKIERDITSENLGLLAAIEKKIIEGFYRLQEAHILIGAIKKMAGFQCVDLQQLACVNAEGRIEVFLPEPVECKS